MYVHAGTLQEASRDTISASQVGNSPLQNAASLGAETVGDHTTMSDSEDDAIIEDMSQPNTKKRKMDDD